jgi:two-component system, cell cycle sensor histidine kinase and response regulator CckA
MITPTTTETILVVDDDRALRELIEVVLARAGYRVLAAPDGAAALKIARAVAAIDLLITDLEMPGLDGSELASRFYAIHPSTPVLFVTTWMNRIDTMEPFEFLAKPFTTDELRLAVRRTLKMCPLASPVRRCVAA